MDLKQKLELYDRLYKRANELIKKHNPCEIKDGQCLKGEPCCNGCKHLTKDGCAVDCLMCKLFLCWRIKQRNKPLTKTFNRMWRKADRHNLLHLRYSKKEMITLLQKEKEDDQPVGRMYFIY